MREFRNLIIWQTGMAIGTDVYRVTAFLPKDEKYGLKTRLQRAAVSIPSNIAEGCSRNSEIDFKRFLENAIGSAYELETRLAIVENVKLVLKEKVIPILQLLCEVQKMLNSFISQVRNRSLKSRIQNTSIPIPKT